MMATTKPRIGYRMRELADIVSAMPGISKRGALVAAGLPLSDMGRWAPLDRTVAAGLVVVERERVNRYRCFSDERARRAWHLRQEALRRDTSPERIAEIRAELDDIERQRAASWVDSA